MPKMNTKPAPIQEQGAGLSVLSTVERAPTLSAGRKILTAAKAAHNRRPQSLGVDGLK